MNRLGLDIGGTDVKIGVVNEGFELIDFVKIPTLASRPWEAIVQDMIDACRPLVNRHEPVSIGIGSPGSVDPVRGVVIRSGNLSFRNVPMVSRFEEAFHLPTCLENDANCALVAEMMAGACQGCTDALILTLGTGVGGGLLLNSALYSGHNFKAGELGHFPIVHKGHPCPCGQRGCFEQYVSVTALISQTREAMLEHPHSLLAAMGRDGVDGRTPFLAAEQGCPAAEKVLDTYADYLACGLNGLQYIFQPQRIVLTGAVTAQGENLLRRVRPHLLEGVDVRISTLNQGGLLGAALLPGG